ncbi:MAG: hypothetical protein IPJ40_13405 [Saprospirales bacterium]|nr:hypothetical protein [Saprospirales bacterium]
MKRSILSLAFLLAFSLFAYLQPSCTGSGRYIDSLFECVEFQTTCNTAQA